MKRQHTDTHESVNKKPRKNLASDVFDDESLNNCLCNVNNLSSALGYLTGSVGMQWNHLTNKIMWNFDAKCCVSGKQDHKIFVVFEGDWVKPMNAKWGPICMLDQIQLSLDGINSIELKDTHSHSKLIYKEGVVLRRTRNAESCFMNTWQLREENSGDWFGTPLLPVTGPLSEIARRMSNGGSKITPIKEDGKPTTQDGGDAVRMVHTEDGMLGTKEHTLKPSPPERTNVDGDVLTTIPDLKPTVPKSAAPMIRQPVAGEPQHAHSARTSNRAKKKERKKQRAVELATAEVVEQVSVGQQAITAPAGLSRSATTSHAQTPVLVGNQVIRLSQIGMENIPDDTPEGWMARLRYSKPQYKYIELKEAKKAEDRVSLIGISVKPVEPKKTRKGDWTTTVYLRDPGLFEMGPSSEFSVVFFQKYFMEWLPQLGEGDILILHDVKLQDWKGNISGVGYHDRVQWAVYSVDQGCFVRPHIGNAPEDQELVDGGRRHTPFLQATEPEEHYCQRLAEWWRQTTAGSAGATSQVFQLGGDIFDSGRRKNRQQLLLCDAGPHVEPNGYFDCIFEVLRVFENDNKVYSLYVTDYTKNPAVSPCQAQWCPPGLNDYVVKFELWDAAATLAESLKLGSYWQVRNARMTYDHNGYVEGKLVERKAGEVDTEDKYPPLEALLKRKEEWEKQNGIKSNVFQHKLLRDVQDGQYITCTVELLHITKRGHDGKYLHVTDYTAHSKLSSYRYGEDWSRNLEGRIISILLRDAQERHVDTLRVGTFLTVKNLRLRDSEIRGRFQGELGGQDILICPLNSKNPNDDLQALLTRKTAYEGERDCKKRELEYKRREASGLATKANSTIGELAANMKEQLKARVIARVTNYYPHSPTEWIQAYCSKCKQRIPEGKKACHHCQDIDHEYVRHKFELMLQIEDQKGDQMDVLLRDECEFLHGLETGDWIRRPGIISEFVQRLRPLLGNAPGTQGDDVENVTDTDYTRLIIGRYQSIESGIISVLLSVED